MKIFGIDFTSTPSRSKPITVAEGEFKQGILTIDKVHALVSFEEFESFLKQKGPWAAGIDFPFGLPGAFLSTLGLPHGWSDYAGKLTGRPRTEFENKIKKFKSKHTSPYKEPLRFTDTLASAQSPLKLINAPVAKMFYEGSKILLKSGASILPCRPKKKENRILLEAYPALVARRFAESYKSESKDTPSRKNARKKIISGILNSSLKIEFGFTVQFENSIRKQIEDDAKGDSLDAVLCSLQAAWAWQQGKPDYGIPTAYKNMTQSEGWIVDPSLKLNPSGISKKQKSSRPAVATQEDDIIKGLLDKLTKLTDIGLALSAERNLNALLEMIMQEARNFTHADGGTLYIIEKDELHFKIFQNDALDMHLGGNEDSPILIPPLKMSPTNVPSHVALTGETINIPDIRTHKGHAFTASLEFYKKYNYRSESMLLVPMKNKDEEVIGVIQLLNALEPGTPKKIIPFSNENVRWIQSMASQAAVAITHFSLMQEIREAYSEVASARDMAMEANSAKSNFLANMTHELRTPMNAIIGYTDMLLEETQEKNLTSMNEDLTKISSSAKILLQLINEILDLSKIEAGKMEIHLDSFKIQEAIEPAVHTIDPVLQKNKNTLTLKCDENLGYMVADMNRVRQTLINLLSNANKFTENGEITLEATRIKKQDAPWIIFKVTDTGIGIAKDKLRSIFSEFTQADTTTSRKYGGTGLGLAISQRFCRMMGGNITVESEVNKGSIFTVHLPAKVIPFTSTERRRASDLA